MAPRAVLLMAYGAAQGQDDLERYYTHIRQGRAPSAAELENLRARYEAIGGRSPLTDITGRQAAGLESALRRWPGFESTRVVVGMKHSPPFIADSMDRLLAEGVEEVYGLVLAPHFSSMSVAHYLKEAEQAIWTSKRRIRWTPTANWHLASGLIDLLAERIEEGVARFSRPESVTVLFTAHSLPERILQSGDPYPEQIQQTGHAVMAQLRAPALAYRFGWQSAGKTRERWLGPDLLSTLSSLAAEGKGEVLVCPVGFVSDHLEILYDLDVEARAHANRLGMHLERTRSLNDDPRFVQTLAWVVAHARMAEAN